MERFLFKYQNYDISKKNWNLININRIIENHPFLGFKIFHSSINFIFGCSTFINFLSFLFFQKRKKKRKKKLPLQRLRNAIQNINLWLTKLNKYFLSLKSVRKRWIIFLFFKAGIQDEVKYQVSWEWLHFRNSMTRQNLFCAKISYHEWCSRLLGDENNMRKLCN